MLDMHEHSWFLMMDGRMAGLTGTVVIGDDTTNELEFISSRTTALAGTVADLTTHVGWLGAWVVDQLCGCMVVSTELLL
jgi:hypothetical protein